MELTYEGEPYKVIAVRELSSVCQDEFSDDKGCVLDCRAVKIHDILSTLPAFCELLQNPKVTFIWLNCSSSKFLELKERLKRHLMDKSACNDIHSYIVKLTTQTQSMPDKDALKTSVDIFKFLTNLQDMSRLLEAHPGMLREGKVSLQQSSSKRKREDETDIVVSQSYNDKRRPNKGVFKLLNKMQKGMSTDKNRACYSCNSKGLFDRFCDECVVLNGEMRTASCDLTGRFSIVTGGRIKIGFETSLRLLRDGCFVIVTTRFTVDAAKRFSEQSDFDVWKHRLKICRLDLLDMGTIEEFLTYVKQNIPHLDILINNAAQTIHRPSQYYESLMTDEVTIFPKLTKDACNLLVGKNHLNQLQCGTNDQSTINKPSALPWVMDEFPKDQKDEYGEPLDLRPRNSWTYNLDEVPLQELLQVLTVNAVGPFVLTAKLKPLLKQSPFERKFVVNVSAMEGQFSRFSKGHRHPHTNMAKAALNMMTRTSGLEYQMDSIYMTSVDTGWVTDERPFNQAKHEAEVKGFVPPLDCQDGAARVYHPIIHGLNPNNSPYFAVFLKNYKPKNW